MENVVIAVGSTVNSNGGFDPTRNTSVCARPRGILDYHETRTIHCDQPVRGRYVILYLNMADDYILAVCEIEVYGPHVKGKYQLSFH